MPKNRHHRTVQRPAARAQVIQAETDAARRNIRTVDSYVNFNAQVGFGAGSQQDQSHYQIDFISRNPYNLEAAYRSNWICGKVVDAYAQDMTRAGIELKADSWDPKDIETMHSEFERMQLWSELCDNIKWGRLYGGSIAVMLVDGQALNTPLRLDTVSKGQFKGLIVLDRWQVNPSLSDLVTEFGPFLGKPKYYMVNASAKALIGQRIHYSRVIRIDGQTLPWRQAIAENGWGQSVLERLWDRVVAFDAATEGTAQLVYKAQLRTMSIKGLRDLIALGGNALKALYSHMDMVRRFQTNEGLTLMDAEDKFETHNYTFAGLSDVIEKFEEQLSGATGIPLVRLFGQTPGGLNNDGDANIAAYHDNVTQEQDQKLRPGMQVLLELVHRSKFGRGLPEGASFEFVSLSQLDEIEKADVLTKKTDAIVKAYAEGIVSWAAALKELRHQARLTGVFSNITDEDIEAADEEPPGREDVVGIDPVTGKPSLRSVPTNTEPKEQAQ